ncbi:MAG: nucleotidyltransferase family protein [Hyphomicrobiaceae bacterium]
MSSPPPAAPHHATPPRASQRGLAAIVLAAGRSSRFVQGHKLTATVDGIPLVAHALQQVAAGPVDDIVVVVSGEPDGVQAAAGLGRWRFAINANAAQGLSTSIRTGIAALEPDTPAAMIVLGDMPGVSAQLIAALAETAASNPGAIVYPVTPDCSQGHPVLWPRDLFGALATLEGDKGAKPLLAAHKDRVVTVAWATTEITRDIDTREDLAAFLERRD